MRRSAISGRRRSSSRISTLTLEAGDLQLPHFGGG
jgi:hypothetical protein